VENALELELELKVVVSVLLLLVGQSPAVNLMPVSKFKVIACATPGKPPQTELIASGIKSEVMSEPVIVVLVGRGPPLVVVAPALEEVVLVPC